MGSRHKDYTGEKFSLLTAVSFSHCDGRRSFWNFHCDCGNDFETRIDSVKRGYTQSCGCLRIERVSAACKKHGESNTKMYKVWAGIKDRCFREGAHSFKHYGGRGITMCSEWAESYETFRDYIYTELGEKPSPQHSIDRINNNGNYEPGNIRWATQSEQRRNQQR
jgi:hypothetical protein